MSSRAEPYIVSEYVEGRSLERIVREDGPLSGGDLERLAIGTATALAAIHDARRGAPGFQTRQRHHRRRRPPV
ncbi:hypothetical protein ACFSTC_60020 [Nonomuraea ferruginea]